MATLVEMALEMVMARARSTSLTADEMVTDLKRFHLELRNLDSDAIGEVMKQEQDTAADEVQFRPALSVKEAFKKNEIACMVCGKGGFKFLTKHLRCVHNLEPKQYREMCGLPAKQPLTARLYSEQKSKNNGMKNRPPREEAMKARKAAKKIAEGGLAAPATDRVPEKTKLGRKRTTKPAAMVAAAE